MLRDVIYWVSIVLMWTAMALNIVVTVRNVRTGRKLDELRRAYEGWIDEFQSEVARLRKAEMQDE